MQSEQQESSFILHVALQLDQHHLLKKLSSAVYVVGYESLGTRVGPGSDASVRESMAVFGNTLNCFSIFRSSVAEHFTVSAFQFYAFSWVRNLCK